MIQKPSKHLWLGLAAISMILAAADVRADETYHINLSPPAHPGEQYKYDAWQKQQSTSYSTQSDHLAVPAPSYSEYSLSALANVEALRRQRATEPGEFTSASLKDFFNSDVIDPTRK